ncbi:hypothetical protein BGZ60DRAFT_258152 [Tricladium varicosporioides]|nr:hypothetical protein BGZ60DRAFT_258152 [Hymenoscyphus varicosporioides]
MSSHNFLNELAGAHDSTTGDFIEDKIPEKLQDDCLVVYMRARFSEQNRIKGAITNHGTEEEKIRFEKELERIGRLREAFATNPENVPFIKIFEYRRALWKQHAIGKREDSVKDVKDRVEKMTPKKIAPDRKDARVEWELRVLADVAKWEIPEIPDTPAGLEEEAVSETKAPKNSLWARFRKEKNSKSKDDELPIPSKPPADKEARKRPSDSYGITVSKITLRKSGVCKSSYMSPETKVYPLNDVLFKEGKENPLTQKCEDDTIRYFHIPANNMHWVEEAIARYYGEKTPGEFNYRKHEKYLKKSSNILCREFWSSRQHGGVYDPVHARHMRAHCSLIMPQTKGTSEPGVDNKNFVIFMPYLHWETHKRRKVMAKVTKEITKQHRETHSDLTENVRDELYKTAQIIRHLHSRQFTDSTKRGSAIDEKENAEKIAQGKRVKRSALAEYLLQIAKLHDAMDVEYDVRILRDHLHQDPPLHLRRTLDQSYYWKIADTDTRDKDQVVYRATKEGKSILRTSRVIMVDQLWLYVLDDNTIISFFPRRWGRNKPDWSGVHKGIRLLLAHLHVGQIESIYDLALLIMDQCSTVFFDSTKSVDERPELLDIFANALSYISGQKTVAFETFWHHLDKMSASERQLAGFESIARSYLNINPEGELLREAHDIIEELRMMTRIFTHQLSVMDLFSEHLAALHDKQRKPTSDEALDVLKDIKALLQQQSEGGETISEATSNDHVTEDEVQRINEIVNENATTLSSGAAHSNAISPQESKVPKPPPDIPETTISLSKRVRDHMASRRGKLQELEEHTVMIADQLKDLLSLKQQQASIIEAKYALKRADESVIQGRSIMLFTIVTIVFLPLSFMSSVFGMNASDFDDPHGNGNKMSLRDQFRLLCKLGSTSSIFRLSESY